MLLSGARGESSRRRVSADGREPRNCQRRGGVSGAFWTAARAPVRRERARVPALPRPLGRTRARAVAVRAAELPHTAARVTHPPEQRRWLVTVAPPRTSTVAVFLAVGGGCGGSECNLLPAPTPHPCAWSYESVRSGAGGSRGLGCNGTCDGSPAVPVPTTLTASSSSETGIFPFVLGDWHIPTRLGEYATVRTARVLASTAGQGRTIGGLAERRRGPPPRPPSRYKLRELWPLAHVPILAQS